jgi:S1-C subfamily serine protease
MGLVIGGCVHQQTDPSLALSIRHQVETAQAVVRIETTDNDPNVTRQGTGFLVSSDGLVVTCRHVIDEVPDATVVFQDGRRLPVEGVAAWDDGEDVVILKIPGHDFPHLTLADSLPSVGTNVWIIGSPRAQDGTIGIGKVSGIRRRLTTSIRTTVKLDNGGSGSPLLDSDGKVLGVMYMGDASASHAEPVEVVKDLLKQDIPVHPLDGMPLIPPD